MPPHLSPCSPAQIRIVADDAGGDFNGMSHGGSWLFLRNAGARACALPALPLVHLIDRRNRVLPTVRQRMAARPEVAVAPDRRVRLSLRWVSGPVYDHSTCLAATRVAVVIGGGRVAAPLPARLCGRADARVTFQQTALEPMEDYPAE